MNIKKIALTISFASLLAGTAQAQFSPGKLAVLRSGDNNPDPVWSLSVARQSPAFIDEFDPSTNITISVTNTFTNGPIFSVALPTNVTDGIPMWFNGHAGSEGELARSADGSILTWSGYTGNIDAIPGTPSSAPNLDRGICVIQNSGANTVVATGQGWYGDLAGQSNPRAVVSDGTNNFWGAGSLVGNLYFTPGGGIQTFDPSVSSTRNVKIINGILRFELQAGDSTSYAPGIYEFVDFNNHFQALPEGTFAAPTNILLFATPYTTVDGYDINPQETIAYTADATYGIQRYEKSGGAWRPTYAFTITNNLGDGGNTGCFGLVVDWKSTNYPIVFATTTEGLGGSFTYSNRLIRLDDTNVTTGGLVTKPVSVTTLATAWGGTTNMVFRGLAFTPDLRPTITTNPVSHSVVAPAAVTFTVGVTANYPNTFQWVTNGVPVAGQTTATYNFGATDVSQNGTLVNVVVSNQFGAVTSATAVLTVNAAAVGPTLLTPVPALNSTNAFGDTILIPVTASGTDPLTYQWYLDTGVGPKKLSNNSFLSGATSSTLIITDAQLTNSGTYTVVVANSVTFASNIVSTNTVIALPPVIVSQPKPTTTTVGGTATFTIGVFGGGLTVQWYEGTTQLANAGEFSGVDQLTLTITGASAPDAGSYYAVVSNQGGTVYSTTNALTLITPPPPSYVAYTNQSQVYVQNFDSLPIPNVTANTANPVTIIEDTNAVAHTPAGSYTYSFSSPYDFAFPIEPAGGIGGLGLSNTMNGWYGGATVGTGMGTKFGANFGDQTTGGQLSYGAIDSTNRALGLLATSTTGQTSFGLKLINQTGATLNYIDLSYIGEIWHQQPKEQIIQFGYLIQDASLPFTTNVTAIEPSLQVKFPTAPAVVLDGTNPTNQVHLAVTNYPVGNWTPGSALWLVWMANENIGGSQGSAIDNLSFSAPYLLPVITNQPQSQGVTVGHPASFSVGVSNAFSLGYQWETNGGAIAGATDSSYSIASAALTDAGSYTVVVTNLYGSVTSAVAVLTVGSGGVPVSINIPPVSQTNFIGATTSFTVDASGTAPLSYFWSFNGSPIPSATSSNLVVPNLTVNSNGTYGVIVSNIVGAAPIQLATLTVVPQPVAITNGPASQSVYVGGTATFAVQVSGTPPFTYAWRTNGVALSDGNGITGSLTGTLTITNAQLAEAGSYSVVVANAGGSVTSAVVTLTVNPPTSFVAYTYPGQIYAQTFDSLPNPGLASVNTGNPITIAGTNYAPLSPFDFAAAIANGGLGLPSTMPGWFGSEVIPVGTGTRVGATAGDQTTGGVLSFGASSSLTAATNRALGLLATGTTGATAFGVRIINQSGETLTNFNLSYTSELWRQTTTAKTVTNFYYVDVTGTNVFNSNNITAGLTNISFTTGSTATGVNGPISTKTITIANQSVTNWTNGTALWVVWEMLSSAGSGQGLGIDNFTFSATGAPVPVTLTAQQSGTSVILSWPLQAGPYTLQSNTTDVSQLGGWANVVNPAPVIVGTSNTVTVPVTGQFQYFRLVQ